MELNGRDRYNEIPELIVGIKIWVVVSRECSPFGRIWGRHLREASVNAPPYVVTDNVKRVIDSVVYAAVPDDTDLLALVVRDVSDGTNDRCCE